MQSPAVATSAKVELRNGVVFAPDSTQYSCYLPSSASPVTVALDLLLLVLSDSVVADSSAVNEAESSFELIAVPDVVDFLLFDFFFFFLMDEAEVPLSPPG